MPEKTVWPTSAELNDFLAEHLFGLEMYRDEECWIGRPHGANNSMMTLNIDEDWGWMGRVIEALEPKWDMRVDVLHNNAETFEVRMGDRISGWGVVARANAMPRAVALAAWNALRQAPATSETKPQPTTVSDHLTPS